MHERRYPTTDCRQTDQERWRRGHGGAWKIAYADFVTAMMAFFLLMWLLGSTAQATCRALLNFFQNPPRWRWRAVRAVATARASSRAAVKISPDRWGRSSGRRRRQQEHQSRCGEGRVRATGSRGAESLGARRCEEGPERQERSRLIDLKGQIEAIIEASANPRQFKNQLLMDITARRPASRSWTSGTGRCSTSRVPCSNPIPRNFCRRWAHAQPGFPIRSASPATPGCHEICGGESAASVTGSYLPTRECLASELAAGGPGAGEDRSGGRIGRHDSIRSRRSGRAGQSPYRHRGPQPQRGRRIGCRAGAAEVGTPVEAQPVESRIADMNGAPPAEPAAVDAKTPERRSFRERYRASDRRWARCPPLSALKFVAMRSLSAV